MISTETTTPRAPASTIATRLSDLQFSTAHLVGVGGSGMKALAELLLDLGWRVTGSDMVTTSPSLLSMKKRGLRVHTGHDRSFLPNDADVVVYSPAIGAANPERRLAAKLGIPEMSYSQMLGHLMQTRSGAVVAGTHGKSTTTAMCGAVLSDAGLASAVVVGAELTENNKSGWAGAGTLFVVEGCEYQRSFLNLRPKFGSILGIEPDHFDYFPTFDDTVAAFGDFAARVAPNGILLARKDCEHTMTAARSAVAEVVTFSLEPGADWWAADVRHRSPGVRFRVFYRGDFITELFLQLEGQHNVLNALAATAMCFHAGVPAAEIRESLAEFRGIRRRFESVGTYCGMSLIDDYAHHPTAVAKTLKLAREKFGSRRIWCAFQPHQISRSRALMPEFAACFGGADEVLIAPNFAARENQGEEAQQTSAELATRIARTGRSARLAPSLDQIIATIDDESRPGDVLITMGAGDINRVHHELTRRLRRNHNRR